MPYELKHIYNNISTSDIKFKGTPVGYVFHPEYPVQGTDQDDRIGNKINLTSMVLDGFLTIVETHYPFRLETDVTNVITTVGGTLASGSGTISSSTAPQTIFKFPQNWYAKFRLILIKHKPDYVVTNSVAWFKKNFVYLVETGDVYTGTYSNQTKVLRESTADTGKFTIVSDTIHKLSLTSNSKHLKQTHKLNKAQASFVSGSIDTPSNLQYTYMVIPPLSHHDYSHLITDFPNNDVDVELVANLKLNFSDF